MIIRGIPQSQNCPPVSIIYGTLWIQLQLLMNGVASGSIIVTPSISSMQSARGSRVEQFELQNRVRLMESYLLSGRNVKSIATLEHQRSQATAPEESILHDWPLLVYAVAAVKTSSPPGLQLSQDAPEEFAASAQSLEVFSLTTIRDALRLELNVKSEAAARHFVAHLHAVGLFRRVDHKAILLNDREDISNVICVFPLPLLLDTSVDVETLVAAIEAGLEDINLSINESVLLLLTRRCWPSMWASEYGLHRLARALLSWICSEVRFA